MSRPPQKQSENAPTKTEVKGETRISIEDAIDQQIGDLVPQRSRGEIVKRVSTVVLSENFSGPLPHPRHLHAYDEISPGAADRIIAMAENQSDHHIHVEKTALDAEIKDQKRGMWMGAATMWLLILAAVAVAFVTENPVLTGIFLSAAAIGVIGKFVNGRSQQ